MNEYIIFLVAVTIAYIGVYLLRRWALSKEILDVPNERSSHLHPTPRGGGLIIVLVTLGFYLSTCILFDRSIQWPYVAGAGMIAAVSWLDDLVSISFGWRILIHSVAAILVVAGTGYWEEVSFFSFFVVNTGWFGAVLTFCWIVWLTNAFNFMDGIDGIAGLQAVIAGLSWLILGILLDFPSTGLLGGLTAFASLGFLFHNWPPAKIFMGDVGSAFLGFTFAVLPILAGVENRTHRNLLPIIGILIVWLFLLDSLITFCGRIVRREKVWRAHRGHLYQRLVISGYSHRYVSTTYGAASVLVSGILIGEFYFVPDNSIFVISVTMLVSVVVLVLSFLSKSET